MVTHDVQEAFELGDRICLMDKGKIVQIGTPSELLFNPADDFVSSFLNEQRLQLELKSVRMHDIWGWLTSRPAQKGAGIPAETNIWAGMELFKFKKDDSINITHKETREVKSASFEQLMSAFYQYKKQQADE